MIVLTKWRLRHERVKQGSGIYELLHAPHIAPGLASTERNNSRLLGTLPKLIYDRRLAWLFFGLYGILVEIMPSQRRGRPHRLKPRFRETRNNTTDIVTRAILDRLRCVIVFSLCRVWSSSACSFSGVSCFRKSATTTDAVQEKRNFGGLKKRITKYFFYH